MSSVLKKIIRSSSAPVAIVFLSVVIIVWWSWRSAISVREEAKSKIRNERIIDTSNSIKDRLQDFEEVLRGAAGVVRATAPISAGKWKAYIDTINSKQSYEDIVGFGYATLVKPSELESFIAENRLTRPEGFNVRPEGQRDLYSIITYLEPENSGNLSAIGYDMYSETVRRKAQELAIKTDESVLTGTLQLIQDRDNKEPGFLMYEAVHRDEGGDHTLENTRGFVYVPFRARDFFEQIGGTFDTNGYAVRIFDKSGNAPVELFKSASFDMISNQPSTTTTAINLSQKSANWDVNFVFDEASLITTSEESRPDLIAVVGALGALLLTIMVWLLIRTRNYDIAAQKEHEVNRAKDSLLSLASHQLRTPATGVKQYLGIIIQGFVGDVTPAQAEMLEKAYSSNERQLRVINEVLHLAKLDSGRIVLAKTSIDIAKLIRDVVLEVGSEVVEHQHKVRTFGLGKSIHITADEHMLRMAIENLITNAIKYTPDGGKIRIKLTSKKSNVEVEVKDNGVGIKPEDQDKLYKQFTRIQNVLSKQVNGTGVGLYLAKQLIELHGGDIKLQSIENKGSTFTAIIPKGSKKSNT
ncbi:MAG: CHASE domain-containing protein [bacterium]|nr:CHASE domain-containing protein [bacterium]